MLPKYLTTPDKSLSKKGYDYEIKATKTIASGRFFDKGDINVKTSDDNYAVDTKLVSKSYTLTPKNVDKLYRDCAPKTPVLYIDIGNYIVKAIIERK